MASLTRPAPAPEFASPPYGVAQAGSLLFTVNRLSQGGTDGVAKLIHYACARLDWTPEMIDVDTVVAGVRERVLRFVNNRALHDTIDVGSVEEQLQSQAAKLKLYAGTDPADGGVLLPDIARYVLKSDAHWLSLPGGRPRAHIEGPPPTDFADPWLSHMCHFGINGHTTRHALFDDMFATIRAKLFGTPEDRGELLGCDGMHDLRRVVAAHNEHHPHERVELDEIF